MRLGGIKDLIQALGGAISETYATALKRASGTTATKFDIDRVIDWLRKNPDFKIRDVYPLKPGEARSARGWKRGVRRTVEAS